MILPPCTLSDAAIAAAAQELALRRRLGRIGLALPSDVRPQHAGDAWAIQVRLIERLTADGRDALIGWKCALPTSGNPVVSPLFRSETFETGLTFSIPVFAQVTGVKVEQELAYVMGETLSPKSENWRTDELQKAVAEVRVALELIDDRYTQDPDLTFADRLADGLFNQGLVLGPAVADEHLHSLASMHISCRAPDGLVFEQNGQHPAQDPMAPLHALVEFLNAQGMSLRAGHVVITGAYAGAPWLPLDKDLIIDFGHLASLNVRFSEKKRS